MIKIRPATRITPVDEEAPAFRDEDVQARLSFLWAAIVLMLLATFTGMVRQKVSGTNLGLLEATKLMGDEGHHHAHTSTASGDNNSVVTPRYGSSSSPLEEDWRTYNIVVNYRVEARIVAINDYGRSERIYGYSNRFVGVPIGQTISSDKETIMVLEVDENYARLAIHSQASATVCDYEHKLVVGMHDGFGATNGFQIVTTCASDGMTYSILAQVAIMESSPNRPATEKTYDISFMNHAIQHHYNALDGWQRVENSDTYKVKSLGAGEMVLDPLEPEYKTITLLEDGTWKHTVEQLALLGFRIHRLTPGIVSLAWYTSGPNYVVIEISYNNGDCSYQYYMAISMEESGMGFSDGMEALKPCPHDDDTTFVILLHAFVVEA